MLSLPLASALICLTAASFSQQTRVFHVEEYRATSSCKVRPNYPSHGRGYPGDKNPRKIFTGPWGQELTPGLRHREWEVHASQ